MASSIREKMAEQEKAKKIARREAKNAVEEGKKPEDNQQQHTQAEVGGTSAEASSGDSPKPSKKAAPKKAVAKKAPAKKAAKKG